MSIVFGTQPEYLHRAVGLRALHLDRGDAYAVIQRPAEQRGRAPVPQDPGREEQQQTARRGRAREERRELGVLRIHRVEDRDVTPPRDSRAEEPAYRDTFAGGHALPPPDRPPKRATAKRRWSCSSAPSLATSFPTN